MKPIPVELRLEIQALTAEHAWLLDHGAADKLHTLYAVDGELLKLPPRDLVGRDAIEAWGRERVKLPRISRHVETNHRLFWDGDTLRGTLYASVYRSDDASATETAPFMVGDYEDEYAFEQGKWLIRQRIIRRAFRRGGHPSAGAPGGGHPPAGAPGGGLSGGQHSLDQRSGGPMSTSPMETIPVTKNPARVYRLDEMPLTEVRPGFGRTGVRSQHAVHTVNWFEPGYKSTGRHSHPFDQMSYVLAGSMRFWVGGEVFDLVAPSVLYIPGGVEHGAEPLGDTRVLNVDVFAPVREDYLPLCEHQAFIE